MNEQIFEYAIRYTSDQREWKDMPKTEAHPRDVKLWKQTLKAVAQEPDIIAIRWNEKGSLQGHYYVNISHIELHEATSK